MCAEDDQTQGHITGCILNNPDPFPMLPPNPYVSVPQRDPDMSKLMVVVVLAMVVEGYLSLSSNSWQSSWVRSVISQLHGI